MSKKKVDEYKKNKANRQQIIKKEKRINMIERIIGYVVCLVAVVWVGFSVYNKATSVDETIVAETSIDTSALDNFAQELNAAEE